jgi:hypothetical protein
MMARKSTPYVMRWAPRLKARPTVEDAPDPRIPPVLPRGLTLEELRVLTRQGATDPRLRPADRWLERWGVTHGAGASLPYAATIPIVPRSGGAVEPLDDRESLAIDDIVKTSPAWAGGFAVLWYRTTHTIQEIATFLEMKRRQSVYEERHLVLAYYLGRFAEIGLDITFGKRRR